MAFATEDLCIGFFRDCWQAGRVTFPQGGHVLEIGSAEGDWLSPMHRERPDLELVGFDYRPARGPRDVSSVMGDVLLTQKFQPASFDAVVSISTIEHIGLGAYGDPICERGDSITMYRIGHWLKPGGICYFDVPYREHGFEAHDKFRAYDDATLIDRLIEPSGLYVTHRQVFTPSHPDAPYIACVLQKAA